MNISKNQLLIFFSSLFAFILEGGRGLASRNAMKFNKQTQGDGVFGPRWVSGRPGF